MKTIRLAVPADQPAVLEILHGAACWLHERGYDQWPEGSPSLSPGQIGAQIARGETYLVSEGRAPVATIAVSADGDPDFWTEAELAEPAVYISKAAVVRRRAGAGIGDLTLRWVIDRAATQGARWGRLDAWRTNTDLHAYYQQRGWDYLRTVELAGRKSGALFQRPATPDPEARTALAWQEPPQVSPGS